MPPSYIAPYDGPSSWQDWPRPSLHWPRRSLRLGRNPRGHARWAWCNCCPMEKPAWFPSPSCMTVNFTMPVRTRLRRCRWLWRVERFMKVCAPGSLRDCLRSAAPCKATTPGSGTVPGNQTPRLQRRRKPPPSARRSCRSLLPSRLKVRRSCGVPARSRSRLRMLQLRRPQAPAQLLLFPQLLLRHLRPLRPRHQRKIRTGRS